MAVAFVCALTASAENRLYLESVSVAEGAQQKVGVMLDNDIVCSNVQFDIILPVGLEMVQTSVGVARVEKSSRLDASHGFQITKINGVWRLSITRGLSSPYIQVGSGALGYFYVKATTALAEKATITFEGKGAGLVADETNPDNKTYAEKEEKTTVTNTSKYGLYKLSATETLDVSLGQKTVVLSLQNDHAITGMEFFATVPAGVTLANAKTIGRAYGRTISMKRVGNTQTYKFLLDPMAGVISAGNGDIIQFDVEADRNVLVSGSTIVFSDAVSTTADAQSKDVQADHAVVTLSTGIQVEASSSVTKVSVVKDQEFVIPVCIKNDGQITGLEARLTLPGGVEFVSVEKEAKRFPLGLDITYSNGKILIAPANSVALYPGEGVLFTLHLKATDNNVSGEVKLTDIVATQAYPTGIGVKDVTVAVERGAIRGDVNEDGEVNSGDVNAIYDIIRENLNKK